MKIEVIDNDFPIEVVPTKTNPPLHKDFDPVFEKIFGTGGFCVNINGSANSGKTNLLINVLQHGKCPKTKKKRNLEKCFDNIFVVSPNLKSLKKNIFEDLEDDFLYTDLNDFLENYEDVIEKHRKMIADEDDTDFQPETLCIFDDIGNHIRGDGNAKKFKDLITNRRHDHISIINLTQRIIQIDPTVRENLSAFITFYLTNRSSEDFIFNEYTKFDKKDKRKFFDMVFNDKYDFLMIDLSRKHSKHFVFYRKFDELKIYDD